MNQSNNFNDQASPCSCPSEVIKLLERAVKFTEASLGSRFPDAVLGAEYMKTFLEQPDETWCAYVTLIER